MSTESESTPRALAYLEERGITPQTVADNRIELCTRVLPALCRLRLNGLDRWHNGPFQEIVEEWIWFPCNDAGGTARSWVARPFPTLPSKDGNGEVKFITPKGGDGYPFIPHATWEVKDKTNFPLLIAEGPCEALAALQAGAFPIAVNGVWMTAVKVNDRGATGLHPAFGEFTLRGRTVYVAFDVDYMQNPSVRQALIRTAILLHKEGSEVRMLKWPPTKGKGLDDFLVKTSNGSQSPVQVLKSLCEDASELSGVIRPCDLEFIELEMIRARLKGSKLVQLCRLVGPTLKVSAEVLRDEINAGYEEDEQAVSTAIPEPWPEPVNGASLADELIKIIRRHVILEETQARAIALWIFLTYLEDVVGILPMLAILSAVKRCGKTTLLSLLLRLVSKPLPASNCSTASLYRVVEQIRPTLLIDEVDAWLKDNEEARGVLNSGHARDMAFVLRCNADSGEPERFSTWSPKVLAGIGKLADTLSDRSITIKLERRKPTEGIMKLRDADPNQFIQVRQKLVRWALDNREDISEARPRIPNALNDREGDNWHPLLAIAEAFDAKWQQAAQQTALSLSDSDDAETVNTLLIAKMKEVLDDFPEEKDFVPTSHLIASLNADASLPWADWSHGKGLTEHKLARILKDFGIKSDRTWDGVRKSMGYSRMSLQPVFERYVPAGPANGGVKAASKSEHVPPE